MASDTALIIQTLQMQILLLTDRVVQLETRLDRLSGFQERGRY